LNSYIGRGAMFQKTRPRVLLADDHAGILTALETMLEPSCEIVASVTDGVAAVEAAARLQPDVAVLDIAMPRMNGLDACLRIQETFPQIKILILTANDDPEVKQEAFRVGASAFVLKRLMAEELPQAIHAFFTADSHRTARE
jgi:DNA-binding NarL/FixJ family response regulator